MVPRAALIHLSEPDTAAQLLAAVLMNSVMQGARITGLVVLPPTTTIPAGMHGHPDVIVLDGRRRAMQQAADRIRPIFDAALAERSYSGALVVADAEGATVAQAVIDHARSSDLVIVRQSGTSWSTLDDVETPDSIALECGRPVMIMPKVPWKRPPGRRALVAWNGSHESARATFDAIPLLVGADAVRIWWGCPDDVPYMASGKTVAHLSEALLRHGINCDMECARTPRDQIGPALLAAVETFDADLVVMGCYGHARLVEFVLGGVTQHILENMRVPVLMSH